MVKNKWKKDRRKLQARLPVEDDRAERCYIWLEHELERLRLDEDFGNDWEVGQIDHDWYEAQRYLDWWESEYRRDYYYCPISLRDLIDVDFTAIELRIGQRFIHESVASAPRFPIQKEYPSEAREFRKTVRNQGRFDLFESTGNEGLEDYDDYWYEKCPIFDNHPGDGEEESLIDDRSPSEIFADEMDFFDCVNEDEGTPYPTPLLNSCSPPLETDPRRETCKRCKRNLYPSEICGCMQQDRRKFIDGNLTKVEKEVYRDAMKLEVCNRTTESIATEFGWMRNKKYTLTEAGSQLFEIGENRILGWFKLAPPKVKGRLCVRCEVCLNWFAVRNFTGHECNRVVTKSRPSMILNESL